MILFAATGLSDREATEHLDAFRAAMPGEAVVALSDAYDQAAVEYAITWHSPPGLLARLPRLAAVFNLGAGVDALLADPTLPDVPIVRYVDPDLTVRMGEWVTLQVLTHHRRVLAYLAEQRARRWTEFPTPAALDVTVGMMGLGVLGGHCASILQALRFDVRAYVRRPPTEAPCRVYSGDQLGDFLAATDILVVLLPLTPATRGMLDAGLIGRLRQSAHGPIVINAGRGALQVEAEIVAALADGTLKGASLDVFETEPLPDRSPLWGMDNVVVTPHVAAISAPAALARRVAEGIAAHRRGDALGNVVARTRGY